MYSGGGVPPWGSSSPPPRIHRQLLRWQNHVKAKIARVVDKILRVAAVIASEEAKICLSKSSFIIFWKIFLVFFGFSMVKIHFLQKILKKWSSFRKKIKKIISITGGGVRTLYGIFRNFFFLWTHPLLPIDKIIKCIKQYKNSIKITKFWCSLIIFLHQHRYKGMASCLDIGKEWSLKIT